MFSQLVPRHAELVAKLALRSDPAMSDLNVREQGAICGHMSTDIPIVSDRVWACRLSRLLSSYQNTRL